MSAVVPHVDPHVGHLRDRVNRLTELRTQWRQYFDAKNHVKPKDVPALKKIATEAEETLKALPGDVKWSRAAIGKNATHTNQAVAGVIAQLEANPPQGRPHYEEKLNAFAAKAHDAGGFAHASDLAAAKVSTLTPTMIRELVARMKKLESGAAGLATDAPHALNTIDMQRDSGRCPRQLRVWLHLRSFRFVFVVRTNRMLRSIGCRFRLGSGSMR